MSERSLQQIVKAGVTSAAAVGVFGLPAGSSIMAKPTTAGSATVYVSADKADDCAADVAAGNFTSGQASWSAWTPGTISAAASSGADYRITCAAIKVTSGTWTFIVNYD